MCGILTLVNRTIHPDKLNFALKSLSHRGPDENGSFVDPQYAVTLGHTRLAIMDPQGSKQPLARQKGELQLTYNGEIYQFEELRKDLESKGHRFDDQGDSEVVLALYEEYGMDFFKYLRGEFAFVIWDRRNQTVLAVRDRFGIKPLFYHQEGTQTLIASEAKGLFATGLVKPEIDLVAVRDYISSTAPDSIFKDIQALPPGNYMKIDLASGKSVIHPYWDLNLERKADLHDEKKVKKKLRESFDNSVNMRLRADVPVGVYLSGGIDSACVLASTIKNHQDEVHAFTLEMKDSKQFNELPLAKKMADSVGANLHVCSVGNKDLLESLEDFLWFSETPMPNLHGVGKYLLSKFARKKVKVTITGEGSDESFLGYHYFKDPTMTVTKAVSDTTKLNSKTRGVVPNKFKSMEALLTKEVGFVPLFEMLKLYSQKTQSFLYKFFHPRSRSILKGTHPLDRLKTRLRELPKTGLSNLRKVQFYSLRGIMATYVLPNLGDRAEMGQSLEARTPFLDHHFFELSSKISDDLKIKNKTEKYILRESFRGEIIPEILDREKWPFMAPPQVMAKGESEVLDRLFGKYLSSEAVDQAEVFSLWAVKGLKTLCWLLRKSEKPFAREMHTILLVILMIQILAIQYVNEFDQKVEQHFKRPVTI